VLSVKPDKFVFSDGDSAEQTVTVTNNTADTVAITKITVTHGFTESHTCGATLPSRQSCTLSLRMEATTLVTRSGSLRINTGSGRPLIIRLSAVAPDTRRD
jgi:hypothetical protein